MLKSQTPSTTSAKPGFPTATLDRSLSKKMLLKSKTPHSQALRHGLPETPRTSRIRWAEDDPIDVQDALDGPTGPETPRSATLLRHGTHSLAAAASGIDWRRSLLIAGVIAAAMGSVTALLSSQGLLPSFERTAAVPAPSNGDGQVAPGSEGAVTVQADRFGASFEAAEEAANANAEIALRRAQARLADAAARPGRSVPSQSDTADLIGPQRPALTEVAAAPPFPGAPAAGTTLTHHPDVLAYGALNQSPTGRTAGLNPIDPRQASDAAPQASIPYAASEEQAAVASPSAGDDPDSTPPASAERTGSIISAVNLRSRPRNGSRVLSVVPGGATVVLENCTRWWCAVRYEGQKGFVASRFVKKKG
ncbi:MAG: SH3 domain-containing protein [Roseibium sp.]|nr:SH3 domain-containing protein [Roseibium sp.]